MGGETGEDSAGKMLDLMEYHEISWDFHIYNKSLWIPGDTMGYRTD
jgi:hypothetical protein